MGREGCHGGLNRPLWVRLPGEGRPVTRAVTALTCLCRCADKLGAGRSEKLKSVLPTFAPHFPYHSKNNSKSTTSREHPGKSKTRRAAALQYAPKPRQTLEEKT